MLEEKEIVKSQNDEDYLKTSLPKTIFKYEGIDYKSLINLKSQSIFMASPTNFNDPYDCSLNFQLDELKNEDEPKIKKFYLSKSEISKEQTIGLDEMNSDNFKAALYNSYSEAQNISKKSFLETYGVSCFSEVNDELLMWAHYSSKYKGFCLEFKTFIEPFNNIKKVNYVVEFPKLDPVSLIVEKSNDLLLAPYLTKSERWNYEKEWRLLYNEAGILYTYPANSLKAIYFGPKIDEQYRDLICLIMFGQNPNVELYQSYLSEVEFKISFTQFKYTPIAFQRK